MCIFGSIQKCTKKITAVKKWPDALLRSTEISQTLPPAVGIRHEKFLPFRFGERPGGHFFKAGTTLVQMWERVRWIIS
jgi:hypothetical protein